MRRIRHLITLLVTLPAGLLAMLVPACGGADPGGMTSLPGPMTRATLAGPLCEGTVCKCREPGDDPGTPVPGAGKRYEIRIGPTSNALWVTVDDMVLYKDAEQATACFYLDLRPGEHPVRLRARGVPGFDARLSISEMGRIPRPDGEPPGEETVWYDTFLFTCGAPGHCDLDQLRDWQDAVARDRRLRQAPCGTTRVSGIAWQTGEAPDRLHPTEIQLDMVLDVYNLTPQHGPGDPACDAF